MPLFGASKEFLKIERFTGRHGIGANRIEARQMVAQGRL